MTCPLPKRECPRHPGLWFTPIRSNQEYCVSSCQRAAHKEEKGFGKFMIDAGAITRAQLRVFYEVLEAVGSVEALAVQMGISDPYTGEGGASGEKEGERAPE